MERWNRWPQPGTGGAEVFHAQAAKARPMATTETLLGTVRRPCGSDLDRVLATTSADVWYRAVYGDGVEDVSEGRAVALRLDHIRGLYEFQVCSSRWR